MIIGDGSVGKTCFLYRFYENKFTEDHIPTIFESYSKEFEVDGQMKSLRYIIFVGNILDLLVVRVLFRKLTFSIWSSNIFIPRINDTAGQEDYDKIRLLAYPGTEVVIMAFNIMARDSFEHILLLWNKEKKEQMKKAKVGKNLTLNDINSHENHWTIFYSIIFYVLWLTRTVYFRLCSSELSVT